MGPARARRMGAVDDGRDGEVEAGFGGLSVVMILLNDASFEGWRVSLYILILAPRHQRLHQILLEGMSDPCRTKYCTECKCWIDVDIGFFEERLV